MLEKVQVQFEINNHEPAMKPILSCVTFQQCTASWAIGETDSAVEFIQS